MVDKNKIRKSIFEIGCQQKFEKNVIVPEIDKMIKGTESIKKRSNKNMKLKGLLVCLMFLFCLSIPVLAGPDGSAYVVNVDSSFGTAFLLPNISTSIKEVLIEKITITATADLNNTQVVTFYDNGYGQLVLTSTTNAAASKIYEVQFATASINYSPIIVQEIYSDWLPLRARYGLYIRKSSDSSNVRVSILYR